MTRGKENLSYLLADRDFFESLDRYAPNAADFYEPVRSMLPATWKLGHSQAWFVCNPPSLSTRTQGWKIHLSAIVCHAPHVLAATVPILSSMTVPFKFALDFRILARLNSKNWVRSGSGKFVTIYPEDDAQFLKLLDKLASVTVNFKGPYILSDRRYQRSSIVYYRYGGFTTQRRLTIDGDRVSILTAPDGAEIPDKRVPYFNPPEWVQDPFNGSQPNNPDVSRLALRNGRYRVSGVLGFSNSGGVYLAYDTMADIEVVIKEARPHIECKDDTIDAKALLKKEHRILTSLASAAVAPRPIEMFSEWEHLFLVQERVSGRSLAECIETSSFTLMAHDGIATQDTSFETYLSILSGIARVLLVLHKRGITFGDLSPGNWPMPMTQPPTRCCGVTSEA